MIPINLKMHNFMCYRGDVPPLSFFGIHTACICGDNGSGKSALIDAFTWALWGKTRAKSDDDLISSGENETEIVFDFSVAKQEYRIIRKRARPKNISSQGQSSLDLQVKSNGGYKSITGDTIQQTEQKVINVLHMDYDTFINSAFLRQGHAAEFTQQRPSKRKEVLSSILGLSIYDGLEEKAKQYVKKYEIEQSRLSGITGDIRTELDKRHTITEELEMVQLELSTLEHKSEKQNISLVSIRGKKDLLSNKRLQLKQTEDYIISCQKDIERWQSQLEQSQAKIREYQALIKQREDIMTGFDKYTSAKKQSDLFNEILKSLATLNQCRHQLEISINNARQQLQKEQAVLENRATTLASASDKLDALKDELKELGNKGNEIFIIETGVNGKHKNIQEMRSRLAGITSRREILKEEAKTAEEKLSFLAVNQDRHCPLCEKPLNEEELKNVRTKLENEISLKSAQLNSIDISFSELETSIKCEEVTLSELEKQLTEQGNALKSKGSILKHKISEAEESSFKLKQLREQLGLIEEHLASKDYAPAEQAEFAKIIADIKALGYDAEKHEKLNLDIRQLEVYDARMKKLEEAEEMLESEQANIKNYTEAINDITKRQAEYQKQQEMLVRQLEELPDIEKKLSAALSARNETDSLLKQVQQKKGSLTERLKRLEELSTRLEENEKLLKQTAEQEAIYKELAKAFGKRGIQAMIIELAKPEIEVEANRLLCRMTDGRFNVKMETQRQTKKGDTVETLDIKISDELGTRDYEMYSGGEAFRIDFAIRVALSKLLARRAGAPLPTLIIDEGFGTQDKMGIERLKEAITSIQDDFEKIFVITHMDELKDAFPTQIQVTKTAQGSTISLN